MPLHPTCELLLAHYNAMNPTPIEELEPSELRRIRAQNLAAVMELAGPPVEMARVENRTIPGPAQPIPVRVYWPEPGGPLPVLVYYHGGGWVIGTLDAVDRPCRSLARSAGCIVVSVDYRLAPEHKFPAAVEDAYAVVQYVADHAGEFDADATRMAVGGDSAGGTLATVAAMLARDQGGPALSFQLLVYPCTDYDDDRPSLHEYSDGHLLTHGGMRWFWGHYLGDPEDGRNPHASPMHATDLSGLPPALVITAECDPIRDQGEAYAERLRAAGVPVVLTRYEGAIHGFFQMGGVFEGGQEALVQAGDALRNALPCKEESMAV